MGGTNAEKKNCASAGHFSDILLRAAAQLAVSINFQMSENNIFNISPAMCDTSCDLF